MKRTEPERAPVSIPTVVLRVHEDGGLTVTLDGAPLTPPQFAPPWRRESFPQIIDQASHDRTRPIRVEVREADGTVFTDLITARRRRAPEPAPSPAPERSRTLPALLTVEGAGFVPGEDVAVAIVTGHIDATHAGSARALIDPAQVTVHISGGIVEVLLFGRISGTTIIQRLP